MCVGKRQRALKVGLGGWAASLHSSQPHLLPHIACAFHMFTTISFSQQLSTAQSRMGVYQLKRLAGFPTRSNVQCSGLLPLPVPPHCLHIRVIPVFQEISTSFISPIQESYLRCTSDGTLQNSICNLLCFALSASPTSWSPSHEIPTTRAAAPMLLRADDDDV